MLATCHGKSLHIYSHSETSITNVILFPSVCLLWVVPLKVVEYGHIIFIVLGWGGGGGSSCICVLEKGVKIICILREGGHVHVFVFWGVNTSISIWGSKFYFI